MSQAIHIPEPMPAALPMLPQPAVVRAIKPESYGVSTYTLSFRDPALAAAYRFEPGQFNMLYLPAFGEVAISLSSDPARPEFQGHTIRFGGSVTQGIARLKVGDTLGLRGPYGSRWPLELAQGKDVLMVSGGIGLAVLRPALYALMRQRDRYGRVLLLYGGRTPQDLLYTDEFEYWQKAGIELHVSVDWADENWKGQVGVIPMLFYRIRLDYKKCMVLTCGPEIMMRFVIYEALARNIPRESIYIAMERNMKCAVGFCGHCQYGPNFICQQGPVLNFAAIEPFFGKESF